MDPDILPPDETPSTFNYVLSFLLVGVAWGFTTPFIRRAAADFNLRQEEKNRNGEQGRASSQSHASQPASGFTDIAEEAELLDRNQDDERLRRRSTSSTRDTNTHTHTDAGADGDVNGADSSSGADGDLPIPAWRSGKEKSWVRRKIVSIFWTVINLLRTPGYAVPLVINLTGSIWFFLLVGKHGMFFLWFFFFIGYGVWVVANVATELSLTVPLANSSAFLFTVLGEWYVERKVIAKQTWLGMGLVLGGIALCVHSKNQGI
jgi:hypothetical protein